MILADSHIHLFPNGYRHDGLPAIFGSGELAAYEDLCSAHGIELALAIGYEADGIDPQNNAYIRRLSATRNWLRTVAYIEAAAAPAANIVETLLEEGHCGIALYVNDALTAQNMLRWPKRIWEVLASRLAIVSINARPEAIALLPPIIEAAAGVPFLFSHLGLPGRLPAEIDDHVLRSRLAPLLNLARLNNVYVKISGLYAISDPPFAHAHPPTVRCIHEILAAFGCQRCLWGSDFSPALEFLSFSQTIDWDGAEQLGSQDRDLVMGSNLARLLGSA